MSPMLDPLRADVWFVPLLVLGGAVLLSIPTGRYLARVMDGRLRPPRWLRRLEWRLNTGRQNWKEYAFCLLAVNALFFVVLFLILALQPLLPFNPDNRPMLAPTTIFHTTISFVTNNSLQHYAGEQHLSYFSQLAGIVWAMFVSGGTGLAALTAVLRGLRGDAYLGNFYVDLWRSVVYVLLPFSLVVGLLLQAAGVPMTLDGAEADSAGGRIARGPVAALVPIKNLASVGGGFFGANSAHPYENPNAWTNALQAITILLFPCAAVVMFGRMLRRPRDAVVLYAVLFALLVLLVGWTMWWDALRPNPGLAGLPVEESGNLEGKELRFGSSGSATYVAATTATSCGSVDCMHDSLNPLAQLTPLLGMWLNCVFGGKGCGLIQVLFYLIVAVFLGGLMVGRTPEYLGRKVEAREMKLAMLALLAHPVLILAPSALFAGCGWAERSASNPGPHGLTQTVYEFSSATSGNGSGMEGLGDTWGSYEASANLNPPAEYSPHWDVSTGLVMLLGRYVPLIVGLALAGGLAVKTAVPPSAGTLRTDTTTFGVFLAGIILLLGALMFLPQAVLGPVAEHFGPIPFGG
jgi:K+-transporting ATPase ATPase A chain